MKEQSQTKSLETPFDIIDRNVDGYITLNSHWEIVRYNPRAMALLREGASTLDGLNLRKDFPELKSILFDRITTALETRTITELDGLYTPRNTWFKFVVYPYEDGTTVCLRDITESRLESLALEESELRFRTIIESIVDGVILIDASGTVLQCNNVIEDMFGYTARELIGRNVNMLMPEPTRSMHDQHLRHYMETGESKIIGMGREVEALRRDRTTFPLDLGVSQFSLGTRRYFVGILRDATNRRLSENKFRQRNVELERRVVSRTQQLKSVNRELERLALHDPLTGLPNRTLFLTRLREGIRAAEASYQKLFLIMLDLDQFKEINETLGHHVGDLLLKGVSKRLLVSLRESDTIAHLGGDEFAVILMRTSDEGANTVAEKIRRSLEPAFALENTSVSVKASLGIATFPDHGDSESTLLQHADVAMYAAKHNNLGYAFYDPSRDPHTPERLTLVSELRKAIQNDGLTLFYQPKIDLRSGRPIGVEALLRWEHKTAGMIFPDVFIPLAERSGLIDPLTYWVIDEALKQCAKWRQSGIDISVSVNLSPKNLREAALTEKVADAIKKWCFDPRNLILEITETSIIGDPAKALEVLTRLNDMNITLSIDDYGTGYSSLAYVKKLPVDEIKIDRSFVQNITFDHDDAVIVKSTINLAHDLGMRVVAEGVEEKSTSDFLSGLGCDFVQGYYFSRPLAPAKATQWLEDSKI